MPLDPDRPYPRARRVLVDERTRTELGPDGVRTALTHLWLGDCQTCNRPLGGAPPSLVMADFGTYVEGSLHHAGCRDPRWDSGIILEFGGTATFLYRPLSLELPHAGAGTATTAAILVNPAIERVRLRREHDGWRLWRHTGSGFTPFDPAVDPRVGSDAVARSAPGPDGDGIEVYLGGEMHWRFGLGPPAVSAVRESAGMLVLVSHAVDPDACDDAAAMTAHLRYLLDADLLDAVWAAYEQPAAAPAADPSPDPGTVRTSRWARRRR